MMRERYHRQLKQMYSLMAEMGGLCQDAIGVSVRTLSGDEETARKLEEHVFAVDGEIDEMEREIETICTKLLLQQQPVARELRRITAALKMITDLERIGDQASDIAELASFLNERWKGMYPIAWGECLRESQLSAWLYNSVCGLGIYNRRKETNK